MQCVLHKKFAEGSLEEICGFKKEKKSQIRTFHQYIQTSSSTFNHTDFCLSERIDKRRDDGPKSVKHPRRASGRERERESECQKERGRECVCVCVCQRDRDRERERE